MSEIKILAKINLWILFCFIATSCISAIQLTANLNIPEYAAAMTDWHKFLLLFSINSQPVSILAAIPSIFFIRKIANNYVAILIHKSHKNISIGIAVEKLKNAGLMDYFLSISLITIFFLTPPFSFKENLILPAEFLKYYAILFIRLILLVFLLAPSQLKYFKSNKPAKKSF